MLKVDLARSTAPGTSRRWPTASWRVTEGRVPGAIDLPVLRTIAATSAKALSDAGDLRRVLDEVTPHEEHKSRPDTGRYNSRALEAGEPLLPFWTTSAVEKAFAIGIYPQPLEVHAPSL